MSSFSFFFSSRIVSAAARRPSSLHFDVFFFLLLFCFTTVLSVPLHCFAHQLVVALGSILCAFFFSFFSLFIVLQQCSSSFQPALSLHSSPSPRRYCALFSDPSGHSIAFLSFVLLLLHVPNFILTVSLGTLTPICLEFIFVDMVSVCFVMFRCVLCSYPLFVVCFTQATRFQIFFSNQ